MFNTSEPKWTLHEKSFLKRSTETRSSLADNSVHLSHKQPYFMHSEYGANSLYLSSAVKLTTKNSRTLPRPCWLGKTVTQLLPAVECSLWYPTRFFSNWSLCWGSIEPNFISNRTIRRIYSGGRCNTDPTTRTTWLQICDSWLFQSHLRIRVQSVNLECGAVNFQACGWSTAIHSKLESGEYTSKQTSCLIPVAADYSDNRVISTGLTSTWRWIYISTGKIWISYINNTQSCEYLISALEPTNI